MNELSMTLIVIAASIGLLVVAAIASGLSYLNQERKRGEMINLSRYFAKEIHGLRKTNEGIRLLYRELELRNEELKRLDEMKSDFVSTVSHELRTPLTIIREGVSLIQDEAQSLLGNEEKDILADVLGNADRLTGIIDDLLDISKLEAARVSLKRTRIDTEDFLTKLAKEFQPRVSGARLSLALHLLPGLSPVYADRHRLIQVLMNLIGNAIKFTSQGGKIILQAKEEEEVLEISVLDTGRGIAKDDLPKLFGKFQQFGKIRGPQEQGTGLGLAISKKIIELHGGAIWAESTLGVGSIFHFTLPKYKAHDPMTARLVQDHIDIARRGNSNEKVSILLMNIMNLGKITADRGVKISDRAVEEVMRLVGGQTLRSGDAVARSNDHQVVVVLPETDREGAWVVRNRIEQALYANRVVLDGEGVDLDLDYAVATYPREGSTAEGLFQTAEAYFTEKRSGSVTGRGITKGLAA